MSDADTASQDVASISWTSNGTARDLRSWLGAALRSMGEFDKNEWLFHKLNDEPIPEVPAMCRFYASATRVGINFIGNDALVRMQASFLTILQAGRVAGLGNADIRTGVISAKPSAYPVQYLANAVVLRKLRLNGSERPPAEIIAPYLQRAVANSINLQAATLGLIPTDLTAADVGIVHLFTLGSTRLENGGKPMTIPRLTRALFTLPLLLEGPWNVGGLGAHGNGYTKRFDQLARYNSNLTSDITPEIGAVA